MSAIDPAHQLVIITRIGEFCDFRRPLKGLDGDAWSFLRQKLLQIEEPLFKLKSQLLAATGRRLVAEIREKPLDHERCSDYRFLLDRLISRSDFVDVAMHLSPESGPKDATSLETVFKRIKPCTLFDEERRPPAERSPDYEKLVVELVRRLELEQLASVLKRKPITAKRRRVILRRMRLNVFEYCTVVRIPTNCNETFTPFMLPRVEALVAASLRFLNKHR